MKRYHIDCTTPVRPPMADAIYPAQLCGSGHYRMVCDVPDTAITQIERWADNNEAVQTYTESEGRA